MNAIQEINSMVKAAQAGYTPRYATQHQVGTLGQNWNAAKNWAKGYSPAMIASFATGVKDDDLTFDQSSISAPTLVDRVHGAWDGITKGYNPYGHTNMGKPITAQEFDNNIIAHQQGTNRKGNSVSIPIDGADLARQVQSQIGAN